MEAWPGFGTDFEAAGEDAGAGAVGGQDILLFRDIKAGSLHTLAPFFSPQVPSSRPPSSRAPRRPHSPGLRGAHKARQLELKIYAKQLLTDCKGVQLCAGRGWEPTLKAQEVAPRPRVKRKTPQWAEGIRQVLTPSCCLGDLSPQQPLDSALDGGDRGSSLERQRLPYGPCCPPSSPGSGCLNYRSVEPACQPRTVTAVRQGSPRPTLWTLRLGWGKPETPPPPGVTPYPPEQLSKDKCCFSGPARRP